MSFIAETKLFTLCDEIKVDGAFDYIKKIDHAIAATFPFITVRIWNSSGPCFITILGWAINEFLAREFKATYGWRPKFYRVVYRRGNADFFAHSDKLFPFNINPSHMCDILMPKEINVVRVSVVHDFIGLWVKPGRFKMRLGDNFFGRPISELITYLRE